MSQNTSEAESKPILRGNKCLLHSILNASPQTDWSKIQEWRQQRPKSICNDTASPGNVWKGLVLDSHTASIVATSFVNILRPKIRDMMKNTMLAGEMPWFQNSKRAQHEDAGKKKKFTQSSVRPCYLNNGRGKEKRGPSYQGHHKTLKQILTETAIGTVKKRDVGFETVQL